MTVTAIRSAEDTAELVTTALIRKHGLPRHGDLFYGRLDGDGLAFVTVDGFLDLRRWAGVLRARYQRHVYGGSTWFTLRAVHRGVVLNVTTVHWPIRIKAVS